MKRNSEFVLCEIAGVSYLLPFGQKIADHRRGLQINATGAYLWTLLETERTREELLTLCAGHYQASPQELPLLKEDIDCFLHLLHCHGLLEESRLSMPGICSPGSCGSCSAHCGSNELYVQIGGLILRLQGPGEAFSECFDSFLLPAPAPPHQTVTVVGRPPAEHPNGTVLVRTEELMIMEASGCYILFFPSCTHIWEARLSTDGAQVVFYCNPPYTDDFREELFHAVRLTYLYLAQKHGLLALHSASLLYRGKAWLFSGHSGAGKSTHTNLWNSLLQTPLINGDLNLLAMQDGLPVIHGLPWCGTSCISETGTFPLGGIIFLKQAPYNRIDTLSPDQKQLLTAQHLISPTWTREQYLTSLSLVSKLVSPILVCRLHCSKTPDAVEAMRSAIGEYLENKGERA